MYNMYLFLLDKPLANRNKLQVQISTCTKVEKKRDKVMLNNWNTVSVKDPGHEIVIVSRGEAKIMEYRGGGGRMVW